MIGLLRSSEPAPALPEPVAHDRASSSIPDAEGLLADDDHGRFEADPQMDESPPDGPTKSTVVTLTVTTIRIVVWTFTNLTLLLAAWVMLAWLLAGWSPVVITSGSMSPTLDAGDVVLIADDDSIGQRDVIVFDRNDELIAHRVFAIEEDLYVTKGDANAVPDVERVDPADVVGAGRLVVPLVGLPIIWAQQGQWLPLAALGLLAGAGAISMALAADRLVRRRRGPPTGPAISLSRIGIQRVRVLTAVIVLGQHFIGDGGSFDIDARTLWITLGAVATLAATNLFSSVADANGNSRQVHALFELSVDTALVVVLANAAGTSSFSWVLFALPIIEAAVRFRLVGALVHWMVLTVSNMSFQLWLAGDRSSETALSGLETVLDQLSVLFLFVIPAGYLSDQLLGELSTWRRATEQATDRSDLLASVADIGRDIVRLDSGYVDTTMGGIAALGFEHVDVVTEETEGAWHVVAGSDHLPAPGSPGSGVRPNDLASGGSIVALDDTDPAEVDALRTHGLSAVVAQVVSDDEGRRLVLRAGVTDGDAIGAERVEAFRLLAGQATVALRNDRLMGEIRAIHDELEHHALHDELTGLPNRAYMLRRLKEAQGGDRAPIVLFLDLDGFKPINDRLGHDAGDKVLQVVAERLLAVAAPAAFVARLGGDEFTVMVTDGDQHSALELADRTVAAIAEPIVLGDEIAHISTSIGIAVGEPGLDDAEIIRRADVAMYDAKHNTSSGRIEVYRSELDQDAERRVRLAADLSSGIDDGSVTLAFQSIVDISATRRVIGTEALVRWNHPLHGAIPPPEIIEIARNGGSSHELNRHILFGACEWVARAHSAGRPDLFIAVNASPEELSSTSLVANVREAIERAGIAPRHLVMEISERVITPVAPMAKANMHELRQMGVRLLLDDFGEGTTALTHLQELPIDGVKIDRQLVVHALRSQTDRLVLESIVELSLRIGHSVIAEGIESEDHLRSVRQAGCTLVQGYHLARPVPGDEMLASLDLGCAGDTVESGTESLDRLLPPPPPPWKTPLVPPTAWTAADFGRAPAPPPATVTRTPAVERQAIPTPPEAAR